MEGKEEKLNRALMKVAEGCCVEEVVEEYAEVDGQLKLTKRKETRRNIPPDLKALQMLLEGKTDEIGAWTDEQLEEERQRLLKVLKGKKTKKKKEKKDGTSKDGDGKTPEKGAGRESQKKGAGD